MSLSRPMTIAMLLAGSLSLAACAPARPLPGVAPNPAYTVNDISVRSPGTAGWRLVESNARGVSFAKQARAPGETLGAQLLTFDLPATETPEQFSELIKGTIQRSWNAQRFELLRMTNEYSAERKYPCVRHRSTFNDKQARISPAATAQLLFEVEALYCRHPLRPASGFAAVYSHRGRSPYPPLADEAREYMQGVQLP